MGYAVAHVGKVVWAVALPCGTAALLSPFPWSHGGTWCPSSK